MSTKTNTAKKTATSTVEKLRSKLVKKSDLVQPKKLAKKEEPAAPAKKLGKKTKAKSAEAKSLITDKKLREKLAGLGIEALNHDGEFKLRVGGEYDGGDFWSYTADDSKSITTSAIVLGEHIENMIEKALELEKEAA